jgi:hypothetical protein
MSEAKYDSWTRERLVSAEVLYRRYTTPYNGYGPHPFKAPAEIRRRIAKTSKVFHAKMKRALVYAERRKHAWLAELKAEQKYLLAAGWTTEPYEQEEYGGDLDSWVPPGRTCY